MLGPFPFQNKQTNKQLTPFLLNRAIIRKIHGSDVDAVFQQAKALSGNAIVDFVRSLCKVSLIY